MQAYEFNFVYSAKFATNLSMAKILHSRNFHYSVFNIFSDQDIEKCAMFVYKKDESHHRNQSEMKIVDIFSCLKMLL